MNEAIFISDLHLHPGQPDVLEKFRHFINWAAKNTRNLYILGDFLHVWPGDDALNAWSMDIANLLADLNKAGVAVFFMAGNRDFLIGTVFLQRAKMQRLPDPCCILLGEHPVVLSHGDGYCSQDIAHQWFRRLTRNPWFRTVFLSVPFKLRCSLVTQVRNYSQQNTRKSMTQMQTVPATMDRDLLRFASTILIHGHTHQPGLTTHTIKNRTWFEYTLSDWDESPSVLCYNNAKYQFISVSEVI